MKDMKMRRRDESKREKIRQLLNYHRTAES